MLREHVETNAYVTEDGSLYEPTQLPEVPPHDEDDDDGDDGANVAQPRRGARHDPGGRR